MRCFLPAAFLFAALFPPACTGGGGERPSEDAPGDVLDSIEQDDGGGDPAREEPPGGDASDEEAADTVDLLPVDELPEDGVPDEELVTGMLHLPFDLEVDGTGTDRIGRISILHAAGSVELPGGAVPVLAYETTSWEEYGYVLFHLVAPDIDDLDIMYLYCGSAAEDSFDYIWHESYDVPMDFESARGTCLFAARPTEAAAALRPLDAVPDTSLLVPGFTVTGPRVEINDGGPGSITLSGLEMTAYPFEEVDCTTDCTADPADGWWELHMVLVDESLGEHCFGILYLLTAVPTMVQFEYGFCIEHLFHLDGEVLNASWTAPAGGGGGTASGGGPRHPELGHILRPHPPLAR